MAAVLIQMAALLPIQNYQLLMAAVLIQMAALMQVLLLLLAEPLSLPARCKSALFELEIPDFF
jgi:hypothetical protein